MEVIVTSGSMVLVADISKQGKSDDEDDDSLVTLHRPLAVVVTCNNCSTSS